MTIAIVLYDQLLFRPMVACADKFRFEQTAAQIVPNSVVLDLFRRSRLLKQLGKPIGTGLHKAARARLALPQRFHWAARWSPPARMVDVGWYGFIFGGRRDRSVGAHLMAARVCPQNGSANDDNGAVG